MGRKKTEAAFVLPKGAKWLYSDIYLYRGERVTRAFLRATVAYDAGENAARQAEKNGSSMAASINSSVANKAFYDTLGRKKIVHVAHESAKRHNTDAPIYDAPDAGDIGHGIFLPMGRGYAPNPGK